jgi:hypothetical protein
MIFGRLQYAPVTSFRPRCTVYRFFGAGSTMLTVARPSRDARTAYH